MLGRVAVCLTIMNPTISLSDTHDPQPRFARTHHERARGGRVGKVEAHAPPLHEQEEGGGRDAPEQDTREVPPEALFGACCGWLGVWGVVWGFVGRGVGWKVRFPLITAAPTRQNARLTYAPPKRSPTAPQKGLARMKQTWATQVTEKAEDLGMGTGANSAR